MMIHWEHPRGLTLMHTPGLVISSTAAEMGATAVPIPSAIPTFPTACGHPFMVNPCPQSC